MWAQPLLRCRDNLAYSVILFTMFFSAQHSSEVCIGSIRDMREGEGEVLNQVGQVLSAPELPSSVLSLSLSLSLSHPPLIPGGMWNPPQCSSFIPCKVGLCRTPSHGRGTRAPGRSQREGQSLHQALIKLFTASFSIGVITSTIDLLSGNAQVRGGVGGTYRSLMRDDLCEV